MFRNIRALFLMAALVLAAAGLLLAGTHEELHQIKLEDLADGESRTFGEGDHKVTVTRNGDQLSVKIDGMEGLHGKNVMIARAGDEVECDENDGDCNVWIGDDGKVIRLEAGSIGKHAMFIGDEGDAHGNVTIKKVGDDGVEIEKEVHVVRIGEGDGHAVTIDVDHDEAGTVLRCPEGDTTMVLDNDKAGQVFLCPQHKVELVPAERKVVRKVIEIKTDRDGNVVRKEVH